VQDLDRSLRFYSAFGFQEVGRVTFANGSVLVMLNLPGDGDVVTLELVYDAELETLEIGNGFSHIVVQVDELDAQLAALAAEYIEFDQPQHPGGEHGPKTSFVHDPDGYRIEIVEWPAGHPEAMTRADFP
jgi:lactoylglutathione lyase